MAKKGRAAEGAKTHFEQVRVETAKKRAKQRPRSEADRPVVPSKTEPYSMRVDMR